MFYKNFYKKIIPLFITFSLSLFAVSIPQIDVYPTKNQDLSIKKKTFTTKVKNYYNSDQGTGSSNHSNEVRYWCCYREGFVKNEISKNEPITNSKRSDSKVKKLKILSKPMALYTEEARNNNIQGSVVLRVTFLSNGKIGKVSAVTSLPYGLAEKAVEAAQKIKFEPMLIDGKAGAVTKSVQYNFTIY